jgi:two-component system, LytTR family, response regulator
MIKSIVVDDVQAVRQTIKANIRDYCDDLVEVIGEAFDVNSAIEEINRLKPQLVFMDIQFEYTDGKEGFDVLKHFGQEVPFEVIFITDYGQNANYLTQAIEVAAVGFVPKPIDKELLIKYVERAKERIDRNETGKSPRVLLENQSKEQLSQEQSIGINCVNSKLKFVKIANIIYFHAKEGLVQVITTTETLNTDRTLNRFSEILSKYHFFRIHHGDFINLHHVSEYQEGQQTIRMKNNTILKIADRRVNDFNLALNQMGNIIL